MPPINNLNMFVRDLEKIEEFVRASNGESNISHLKKIVFWGRLSTFLGLATAWVFPNPISAYLISQGKFTRWTSIAHHVLHRGYDKIPDIPKTYTSKYFAQGWRRFIDWFDWMIPAAWNQEHNVLHHYRLGETADPDLVQRNVAWLRKSKLWQPVKLFIVFFFACTWKFTYYSGNVLRELYVKTHKNEAKPGLYSFKLWNPFGKLGSQLWFKSFVPYAFFNFLIIPSLFLPFGLKATFFVLINMLLAEIFTNIHGFIMIVTNHAGEDIYEFDDKISGKDEFYYRQIVGSTNFKTGGDLNDFLHGFLNYQIEHHIWPNMTMQQYQIAQPLVKELCEKHLVSYVQESVWIRLRKTIKIMVGTASMKKESNFEVLNNDWALAE